MSVGRVRVSPPRRLAPTAIKGATKAPFPGFIEPSLATLKAKPPTSGAWSYEIKFDGWRVQAHVHDGHVSLFTRNGHDWTDKFGEVAQQLAPIGADVVIDGEIVASDNAQGIPSFGAVRAYEKPGRSLAYYVFDLLYWKGRDLRGASQLFRRLAAEHVIAGLGPSIRFSESIPGDGKDIFQKACAIKLEGIIAKRLDATYRSGRSENWQKIKCTQHKEFEIVGFVPAPGSSIAALYLGERRGNELVYAGKVGTGFSNDAAASLREKLEHVAIKGSPLTKPVSKPKARWVYPRYRAAVEFLDQDKEGFRHASFKGLVEPKSD